MPQTLNRATLIGYLGQEVKIHYYRPGACVARFSLATHEQFLNSKTNEQSTFTQWHEIVAFNEVAQFCEIHLKVGDLVFVEGKLKTKHFKTSESTIKQLTEVHAERCFVQSNQKPQAEKWIKDSLSEKLEKFEIPKISDFNSTDDLPF